MLTLASFFPGIKGRADSLRCRDSGHLVGDNDAEHLWPPCGAISLNVGSTGQRLNDRVVHPLVGIGTLFTKTINRDIDQLLVELAHHRFTKSHAIHRSWPEVLQQDVGTLDQIKEDFFAAVRLEVHRDRPLAAIAGKESRSHFIDGRPDMTHLLTGGRLNLDYLGALIRQHHCRDRS